MFPVPEKPDLSIDVIADYWSRTGSPAKERELEETMIRAWWGGKLEGPKETKRLEALKVLYELGGNGEVVFLVSGTQSLPEIVERAGGAEVDLSVRLSLPGASPDNWTEDNCAEAFEALSIGWTEGMSEELTVALLSMSVSRLDFMDWIAQSGFSKLKFWRDKTLEVAAPKMSVSQVREFVENYVAGEKGAGRKPSQTGAEEDAKRQKMGFSRSVLRRLYKENRRKEGVTISPGRSPG
jgi:hypothetical protein